MSSAAKLRKAGRGTATIAAAALVMTSFGPAAFAWAPVAPAGAGSDTAYVGSLGVIDADTSTPGTQGAQSVQAGVSGQAMADMRMVLPATWQQGDHIDLQLGWTTDGTAFTTNSAADAATRVQWSSAPTVNVDTKAYAVDTHVHSTSTVLNDPAVDNATEQHTEDGWVDPDPQTVANPVAPTFATPQLVTGENGTDVVRLTFSNSSDNSAQTAKYIMSVNGPKVDVGSRVTGDIGVRATGYTGAGVATPNAALFQDETGAAGNITWPAFVASVNMTVEDGAIASQNVAQTVGPITVTPTDGAFAGGNVSVAIQNAQGGDSPVDFVAGQYTATIYDAAGKVLSTQSADVTAGGTLTATAVPAGASRVVFSGMLARDTQPGSTSKVYQYTLTSAGGETSLSGPLGGTVAGTNQNDIARNDALRVASQTTSVMGTRIGGSDRYQTAVRVADNRTTYNGTIVLASGERWADAMSSGYLAKTKGAPILLTPSDGIPQSVMEFMKRRGVQRVYIVGGERSVSEKVENQLREMDQLFPVPAQITTPYGTIDNPVAPDGSVASTAKMNVTRLGGADRFETNKLANQYASYNSPKKIDTMVTQYGEAGKTTGILASGLTPWDALSAGPMVDGPNGNGMPIILSTGSTFHQRAAEQVQSLDITQLVMVGGTSVLSDSLKSEANRYGVTASLRLAGQNRYGTAKAIGELLLNAATTDRPAGFGWGGTVAAPTQRVALVANGGQPNPNAFADALAAGPLAISLKSPIVLTTRDALPTESREFLDEKSAALSSATALGQGAAVSTEVLNAANALVAD